MDKTHASKFVDTEKEKRLSPTSIDEIAKIANWKSGGPAETPAGDE